MDRRRRRQWSQLLDEIDSIPGATEPRPMLPLDDYYRAIDVLRANLQGFRNLYVDVSHAEALLDGLENHRQQRVDMLELVSNRRASYEAAQFAGYEGSVAYNQLNMAERRLRAPTILHALHLIAAYRAVYQNTGDSVTDSFTPEGASLARQLGTMVEDHRQMSRLLNSIGKLLDDPTQPIDFA